MTLRARAERWGRLFHTVGEREAMGHWPSLHSPQSAFEAGAADLDHSIDAAPSVASELGPPSRGMSRSTLAAAASAGRSADLLLASPAAVTRSYSALLPPPDCRPHCLLCGYRTDGDSAATSVPSPPSECERVHTRHSTISRLIHKFGFEHSLHYNPTLIHFQLFLSSPTLLESAWLPQ